MGNDACNSNQECQSFGFWTGPEKSKGHCALFDKACSCDGVCSGVPTGVKDGYTNDVFNKDKSLCTAEKDDEDEDTGKKGKGKARRKAKERRKGRGKEQMMK